MENDYMMEFAKNLSKLARENRDRDISFLINEMLTECFDTVYTEKHSVLRDKINAVEIPQDIIVYEAKNMMTFGERTSLTEMQHMYEADKEYTAQMISERLVTKFGLDASAHDELDDGIETINEALLYEIELRNAIDYVNTYTEATKSSLIVNDVDALDAWSNRFAKTMKLSLGEKKTGRDGVLYLYQSVLHQKTSYLGDLVLEWKKLSNGSFQLVKYRFPKRKHSQPIDNKWDMNQLHIQINIDAILLLGEGIAQKFNHTVTVTVGKQVQLKAELLRTTNIGDLNSKISKFMAKQGFLMVASKLENISLIMLFNHSYHVS